MNCSCDAFWGLRWLKDWSWSKGSSTGGSMGCHSCYWGIFDSIDKRWSTRFRIVHILCLSLYQIQVRLEDEGTASYCLTSTVMLSLTTNNNAAGTFSLSGSIRRQVLQNEFCIIESNSNHRELTWWSIRVMSILNNLEGMGSSHSGHLPRI